MSKQVHRFDGWTYSALRLQRLNRKLLTRIELEEITEFVQPRKQCECLHENGIFLSCGKMLDPAPPGDPLSSRQLIQVESDEQPDYGSPTQRPRWQLDAALCSKRQVSLWVQGHRWWNNPTLQLWIQPGLGMDGLREINGRPEKWHDIFWSH